MHPTMLGLCYKVDNTKSSVLIQQLLIAISIVAQAPFQYSIRCIIQKTQCLQPKIVSAIRFLMFLKLEGVVEVVVRMGPWVGKRLLN